MHMGHLGLNSTMKHEMVICMACHCQVVETIGDDQKFDPISVYYRRFTWRVQTHSSLFECGKVIFLCYFKT